MVRPELHPSYYLFQEIREEKSEVEAWNFSDFFPDRQKKLNKERIISCVVCGKRIVVRGSKAMYCERCSKEKRLEARRRFNEKNKLR